jgi:lysyl-tRNA synthetase class 2
VLEVDTPFLVNHPVERCAHPFGAGRISRCTPHFLHTSPEYAMKRLLAAGSGDIFQICHVVRALERSRVHNSEFTLLEWYRIGFSLGDLMDEVEALVRDLAARLAAGVTERLTYRDAFRRELALDPFDASDDELARRRRAFGFVHGGTAVERLETIYSTSSWACASGPPSAARDSPSYSYPASQAALARRDPHDARTAERFELYRDGVELANGYHELASSVEQRERFEADNEERRRRGMPTFAIDEHLLAALAAGLPDCAGVALGVDRLLMLASGAAHIDEVIAFPTERA